MKSHTATKGQQCQASRKTYIHEKMHAFRFLSFFQILLPCMKSSGYIIIIF